MFPFSLSWSPVYFQCLVFRQHIRDSLLQMLKIIVPQHFLLFLISPELVNIHCFPKQSIMSFSFSSALNYSENDRFFF